MLSEILCLITPLTPQKTPKSHMLILILGDIGWLVKWSAVSSLLESELSSLCCWDGAKWVLLCD